MIQKEIFPLTVHFFYEFPGFRFDIRYIDKELGLPFYDITGREDYLCGQYPELYFKLVDDLFNHPYFIKMALYVYSKKIYLHEIRKYNSLEDYTSEMSILITSEIYSRSSLRSISLAIPRKILRKLEKEAKEGNESFLRRLCSRINLFYENNKSLARKVFYLSDEGREAIDEYMETADKLEKLFKESLKNL